MRRFKFDNSLSLVVQYVVGFKSSRLIDLPFRFYSYVLICPKLFTCIAHASHTFNYLQYV